MLSISKTVIGRATLVLLIAALVTAGCARSEGAKPPKNAEDYTKVTLAELNRDARGFVTRKVCFDAYFVQRTNLYPTFPTPFSRTDYVNFAVWPRGARLWKADEMENSYPQMYVGRQTGGLIDRKNESPLRVLDHLKKYQPLTIYGVCELDTSGYAWVVVDAFLLLDGVQYTDEVIRRLKLADEHFANKEYAIAGGDYRKALTLGVPAEVVGWVHKNIGLCHLTLEEYGAAEKELLRAGELGASDAEALIALAEAQNEMGKLGEAEKNARAALLQEPRSPLARAQLAISLGRQKRFEAADDECQEALKINVGDADVLRARGLVEDLAGKVDRAIETYKMAVLSRPADSRIHRELGHLYVKKNDLDNARLEFRNVIDSVGPTHALRYCRGCCLLAGVLEALGEHAEAAKYYRLAQQRDERYIPAYLGYGSLLAAGKMYDESIKQFGTVAKELDPKGESGFKSWRGMGAVYHAKADKEPEALQKAGDCYRKAVTMNPGHYDSWLDLALCRWQQEKPDRREALSALGECFRLKSNEARPHYLAGCILSELHDFNGAVRELENAKRLEADNPRTMLRLALAYRELGNDTRALTELQEAGKLDVKDTDVSLNIKNSLAYLLADMGRPGDLDEAFKLAQQVVAAKGGNPAYMDTLGWVQARRGKLVEARKTLEDAAGKSAEGNPAVFYHLGYVLHGMNDYSGAIKVLETAQLRMIQANGKTERPSRLQAAIKSLLDRSVSERDRREAERRRRRRVLGDPDKQTSSPKEGQTPGKRAKPEK